MSLPWLSLGLGVHCNFSKEYDTDIKVLSCLDTEKLTCICVFCNLFLTETHPNTLELSPEKFPLMTLKQHVINQKTPPKQVFYAVQHEDSHQYVDLE